MHSARAVILICLLLASGSADGTATVFANRLDGVSEGLAAKVASEGQEIDLSKFPYVSLTDANGKHVCLGTLVSPIVALTTASCVDKTVTGFDRYLSVANFPVHDGGALESSVGIVDVVVHEKYRNEGEHALQFDIAFVELEMPFRVQPAVLPLEGTYDCISGHLAAVTTVPETTDQSEKATVSLKQLSAKSLAECTGQTARNDVHDAEFFCSTATEGQLSLDRGSASFCLQDQQKPPVLLGLALRSADFRDSDDASVFIDVSSYLPWILKNEYELKTMVGFSNGNISVPFIIGGRDAGPGEFPYAVSVWPSGFIHQCNGALISPRHVLTAAAHLLPFIRKPYRIHSLIGDIHLVKGRADDAERIVAEKVIIHPDLKDGTDLAIIVLKTPSTATPINLPTEDNFGCCTEKQILTLFGWGPTTTASLCSNELQTGNTFYYSHDECEAEFDIERFASAEICGIDEAGGTSLCARDTGTGLVFTGDNTDPADDVLIGIGGSQNSDADCEKVPSRFIDVKSSVAWIEEVLMNSST